MQNLNMNALEMIGPDFEEVASKEMNLDANGDTKSISITISAIYSVIYSASISLATYASATTSK